MGSEWMGKWCERWVGGLKSGQRVVERRNEWRGKKEIEK